MFDRVARRYDLANRVMSLGLDIRWRKALARRLKIIDQPGRLLDLAAGTGDQIVAAKRIHPSLAADGLDLSPAMVALAEPKWTGLAPPRPEMVIGSALSLPYPEGVFDSVSISFGLRNIPDRAGVYAQVRRVLKPGGRFLVLEAFHDRQSLWAPVTGFYLKRVMPALGGRLVSRERAAYDYLADSVLAFPRPEALGAELAGAGFGRIAFRVYAFSTVMLVWGDKPADGQPGAGQI
jgi:demethylmenaquinone methyltransferase/2-methoxy-6-polyprenyl-1,4-benzoquinol methylase